MRNKARVWAVLTLATAVLSGCPLSAGENELKPFAVDWASSPESPASVAFLLDAPAGKGGFVRVADGHLVRSDGTRLRLWGVNVTGRAGLPVKTHAPNIAAHLARCGVNAVRFHFLDQAAPDALIDARRNDTQALDSGQLDRLDYFIAQLKARGHLQRLESERGPLLQGRRRCARLRVDRLGEGIGLL